MVHTKGLISWTQPDAVYIDYLKDEALLHSVVRAATTTPEILDHVLAAGADTSAWTQVPAPMLQEKQLSPSGASISTPLHAAIATCNTNMIQSLLDRGFNPNAQALIAGSQGFTPSQYAVITKSMYAYSVLKQHPQVDIGILMPVYKVHILHFAVA